MTSCRVRLCLGVSFAVLIATAASGRVLHVPEKVANSYIVTLNDGERADGVSADLARAHGGAVTAVMSHIGMFAISLPNETAAEAIARDPRVREVQENGILYAAGMCRSLDANGDQWALGHVNDRNDEFDFSTQLGSYLSSVKVYVIDSTIDDSSADFRSGPYNVSKVIHGPDYSPACAANADPGGPYKTGTGISHGAAVASVLAGNVHGVVPELNAITSVVALNCLGTSSDASLAQSADYVVSMHTFGTPTVVNVSIATSASDSAYDTAIKKMVDNGIFVTAAAGNNQLDACSTSPAELGGIGRYPGFMSVGSTTFYSSQAGYSNKGSCIDIWAPGGDSNTGVLTSQGVVWGTSVAAPAVAGAAVVLFSQYPTWSPSSVWYRLRSDAVSPWGYKILHMPPNSGCVISTCNTTVCPVTQ
jgi:serine protease